MKSTVRLIIVIAVGAALAMIAYLARQATEPQSAIIAKERNRFAATLDQDRLKADPIYATGMRDKIAFLDYRLAVAYNTEHKPDRAIAILLRLISEEESQVKQGAPRRSRSYMAEADYYEALKESYELKNNEIDVNSALEQYTRLRAKGMKLRTLESREEGKYVGSSPD